MMNSSNNSPAMPPEGRGVVLAEYRRRISPQVFFIGFFLALFLVALDALVVHRFIVADTFGLKLACLADMIASVFFVGFLFGRLVANQAPITATDRGLVLGFGDFRTRTLFIPWNKIAGARMGILQMQLFYKMKYLILAVAPGFPLPKRSLKMFNQAENELVLELNHLTKKPEEMIAEIWDFRTRLAGGPGKS